MMMLRANAGLALIAALTIGLAGCGSVEVDQMKAKVDQATKDAESARTELKKVQDEASKKITALEGDVSEKQSNIATLSSQLQAIRSSNNEILKKSATLETEKFKSDMDRSGAETRAAALANEVNRLKTDRENAVAAAAKSFKELLDVRPQRDELVVKVESLEKKSHDLAVKLKDLKDNPYFSRDYEAFSNNKPFYVSYVNGKDTEAREICRLLGIRIEKTDEDLRVFKCRAVRPITEESIDVLVQYRSVIQGIRTESRPRTTQETKEETRPRPSSDDSSTRRPAASRVSYHREPLPPSRSQPQGGKLTILDAQEAKRRREYLDEIIHAGAAWNLIRRQSSSDQSTSLVDLKEVKIAIIDEGFDINDKQIIGKYIENDSRSFAPDDIDHQDRVSPTRRKFRGADISDRDNIPYHHGTHCASIILATAGLSGSDEQNPRKIKLMLLKIDMGSEDENYRPTKQLTNAINHAVEHGAKVISLSVVIYVDLTSETLDPSLREACVNAAKKGCLIVCAAGQADGRDETAGTDLNNSKRTVAPAYLADPSNDADERATGRNYGLENQPRMLLSDYILPVSGYSVTPKERIERWSLSNYFSKKGLDLGAPGGKEGDGSGIVGLAALPSRQGTDDSKYVELYGTSQAAPHVAAAAAMLFSLPQFQLLDGKGIKSLLIKTMQQKIDEAPFLDLKNANDIGLIKQPPFVRDAKTPDQQLPYELGVRAFRQGDMATAESQFALDTKLHPYAPDGFYFLALTQARRGDLKRAEQAFQIALNLDRRRPLGESWAKMTALFPYPQREALVKIRANFLRDGKMPSSFQFLDPRAPMIPASSGPAYSSRAYANLPSVTYTYPNYATIPPGYVGPMGSGSFPECCACPASGRGRIVFPR